MKKTNRLLLTSKCQVVYNISYVKRQKSHLNINLGE